MATNFFQRWSSRKLQAREENKDGNPRIGTDEAASLSIERLTESASPQTGCAPETPAAGLAQQDPACLAVENDAETESLQVADAADEMASLTLADVSAVSYDSGVTGFMKQGVEKSVKKAALRKLFHSDEFNYISDMDDHTEDFSNIPALDSKVTAQLRNWLNEAAETVETLLDAGQEDTLANSGTAHALGAEIESGIALPSDLSVYEGEVSAAPSGTTDGEEVKETTEEVTRGTDAVDAVKQSAVKQSV